MECAMLRVQGGVGDVVPNSPARRDKVIVDTDPGIGTVPPPLLLLFFFSLSFDSLIRIYLRIE